MLIFSYRPQMIPRPRIVLNSLDPGKNHPFPLLLMLRDRTAICRRTCPATGDRIGGSGTIWVQTLPTKGYVDGSTASTIMWSMTCSL